MSNWPTTNRPFSDRVQVGVPRQFSTGTALVMMTLFAVLFSVLTSLGAPAWLIGEISLTVFSVGLGQMLLFGGRDPRGASVLVGMVLVPSLIAGHLLYIYFHSGAPLQFDRWTAVFFPIWWIVFGATCLGPLAGYLIGLIAGSVFLFWRDKPEATPVMVADTVSPMAGRPYAKAANRDVLRDGTKEPASAALAGTVEYEYRQNIFLPMAIITGGLVFVLLMAFCGDPGVLVGAIGGTMISAAASYVIVYVTVFPGKVIVSRDKLVFPTVCLRADPKDFSWAQTDVAPGNIRHVALIHERSLPAISVQAIQGHFLLRRSGFSSEREFHEVHDLLAAVVVHDE